MIDPQSRLAEAQKQIRLAAEDLERLSTLEELDEDVVEDLDEAARLLEEVQAALEEVDDDATTKR